MSRRDMRSGAADTGSWILVAFESGNRKAALLSHRQRAALRQDLGWSAGRGQHTFIAMLRYRYRQRAEVYQTPRRRRVGDTLALHLRGVVAGSPGGTSRTRIYSRHLSGSSWVNLPLYEYSSQATSIGRTFIMESTAGRTVFAAAGRGMNTNQRQERLDQQRQARTGRPTTTKTKTKTRRPRPRSHSSLMDDVVALRPPSDATPSDEIPRLIVYDLDDTIWFPELYMAGRPSSRGLIHSTNHYFITLFPVPWDVNSPEYSTLIVPGTTP